MYKMDGKTGEGIVRLTSYALNDLTILIPRDLYLYLANDWRGALMG